MAETTSVSPPVADPVVVAGAQRRAVRLLVATQVLGGLGVGVGVAVGALLAASLGGAGVSGLAGSATVVGAALLVVPATRLMRAGGRRRGLTFAYLVGGGGGVLVVVAAAVASLPLVLAGMVLFGGGTAANLQARYAAVDLASPSRRARQLALVVWATTIGAVAGPNLAPLAGRLGAGLGLDEYAAPFALSAVLFTAAGGAVALWLRPDPLLLARSLDDGRAPVAGGGRPTGALRSGRRALADDRGARLGVLGVATGHVVMVAVMSMTPVHLAGAGHDHGTVLRLVGLVISLHIAGMYALSPLVGWLTDRAGRRAVLLGGAGTLVVACAVAGTAGHGTAALGAGLVLLGVGWSATMVAGSTLLSESVPVSVRSDAQSFSDLAMGLAGATSAALAGVVVDVAGYASLTLVAAACVVPLVVTAVRARPEVAPVPALVVPAEP